MMRLTPLQGKAVALSIFVLLIALAVGVIATPVWLLNRRYDMAVEDAVAKLERYSRIIGMRDGLQRQAVEIKALESTQHFLKSASPSLAAAELQEKVKTILDENGAKVSSMQILSHKDEGAYRKVSVALQLTAPHSALKAMLYALESARPYLFVDNFSVRAPYNAATRNDLTAEPDLTVQFDLTAYALKGTP